MGGSCKQNEEGRSALKILTCTPAGKRPLGMDVKEIGMNRRNWVDSAQVGIIGETLLMRH